MERSICVSCIDSCDKPIINLPFGGMVSDPQKWLVHCFTRTKMLILCDSGDGSLVCTHKNRGDLGWLAAAHDSHFGCRSSTANAAIEVAWNDWGSPFIQAPPTPSGQFLRAGVYQKKLRKHQTEKTTEENSQVFSFVELFSGDSSCRVDFFCDSVFDCCVFCCQNQFSLFYYMGSWDKKKGFLNSSVFICIESWKVAPNTPFSLHTLGPMCYYTYILISTIIFICIHIYNYICKWHSLVLSQCSSQCHEVKNMAFATWRTAKDGSAPCNRLHFVEFSDPKSRWHRVSDRRGLDLVAVAMGDGIGKHHHGPNSLHKFCDQKKTTKTGQLPGQASSDIKRSKRCLYRQSVVMAVLKLGQVRDAITGNHWVKFG